MLTTYFDGYVVGQHRVSRARTITETDVVLFAAFSGDWYPLHTDAMYAQQGPFGQRIAHGLLVLSVASGLLEMNPDVVLAFYGMDRVRFTAPTFIGDTLHAETVVQSVEEKSAQGGLVAFGVEVKKHSMETVLAMTMKVLVAKSPK